MGREFTGESAFVDAYSEYFDVVYREALRYSGNHHVAEEIAQDAFFMAYVQNGNKSKQQIKAWMLMLAKYRAMNYIRDHKREVSLEEITMSEDKYPDALVDGKKNFQTAVDRYDQQAERRDPGHCTAYNADHRFPGRNAGTA